MYRPGGWAVTGLACRYPGAASADALRERLRDPADEVPPAGDAAWRLPDPVSSYADFGIPPIYRRSINRVQLDALEMARDALAQAGLADGGLDAERTDVIFVTAFGMNRCHENHARVLGVELAAAYARTLPAPLQPRFVAAAKARLDQAFSATSHDKVGEMASTIASRIASCFKLRGRALALEAQDVGGAEALLAALDALAQARAHAVLIVGVQRIESALLRKALAHHLGAHAAPRLGEGACALVLQGAEAQAGRVLARIADLRLDPGQDWRTSAAALRDHGASATYWAVGGLLDASALGAAVNAHDTVRSLRVPCGHGHAVEALTTLAHAVLAQQNLPDVHVNAIGTGLHGETYAMRMLPASSATCRGQPLPAPVAVIGAGACFGPTRGLDAYWEALDSGQPQFRPLQGRRFRPDLYGTDDASGPLAYGIGAASFAEPPAHPASDGLAAPAFPLALAAAEEAIGALRHPAQWASQDVLVVVATNLTQGPERRLAAQEHQPRIEALLQALAEAWTLDEIQQAQGLRALREAASLPADAAVDGLDRLPASAIARRMARCLGSRPARCVALEAACAGSLVAVELAMMSLRARRCAVAVVVGVELPVNVHDLCLCASQRMLAPDLIATFTEQATGFTPGDGAGALVLTLKDAADRTGEQTLAVLRAVASCTESQSIIAPNTPGQVKSMQRAFEQVSHGPADVAFVETHGTGTAIGDAVEIESLAGVYGGDTRETPLRLGALKAQFGHCFAAAGMASVVKTVLALRHERLPANHFAHPLKAALRLAERRFDPLQSASDWPRTPGHPRRAAVNGFGTGGLNVHLLLDDGQE